MTQSDWNLSETTVWKFEIQPWQTAMEMPAGARVLHAHEQDGKVCVWAEVDPNARTVLRKVLAVPTGGLVTGYMTYVGTVHVAGFPGPFVFHVYDGGEVDPLAS